MRTKEVRKAVATSVVLAFGVFSLSDGANASVEFDLAYFSARVVNDNDSSTYVKFDTPDFPWLKSVNRVPGESFYDYSKSYDSWRMLPECRGIGKYKIGRNQLNIKPLGTETRSHLSFTRLPDVGPGYKSVNNFGSWKLEYNQVFGELYSWASQSQEQMLASMDLTPAERVRVRGCMSKAIATAKRMGLYPTKRLACRRSGRRYRNTELGIYCLSDYEYASLEMERQNAATAIGAVRSEAARNRAASERLLKSQTDRLIRESDYQRALDRLRNNTYRCTGNVYSHGSNSSSYNASCSQY